MLEQDRLLASLQIIRRAVRSWNNWAAHKTASHASLPANQSEWSLETFKRLCYGK